jgi:hypothetical protein
MAESGVIGLLGFLALHILPLWFLWPGLKSGEPLVRFWVWCALAVFLQLFLNGLTDNIFSLKPLMYIYWTTTAAAFWVFQRNKEKLLAAPILLGENEANEMILEKK